MFDFKKKVNKLEDLKITRDDFMSALEEVKP